MNNSKSILILDTPKNCHECIMYDNVNFYCEYSNCPLASLPLHKDLTRYIHRGCGKTMANGMMYVYDQGWNDCIDFILQNNKNT